MPRCPWLRGCTPTSFPGLFEIYLPNSGMLEINIYQSWQLASQNGVAPKRTVKTYLQNALRDIDAEIRTDLDPVEGWDETSHCSGDSLEQFAVGLGEEYPEAEHSNLLLLDDDSGGCGYVGGKACTAPGKHITQELDYKRSGEGKAHENIHAALHQVGHNLGAYHDHDPEKSGKQHPGVAWNEHNTFLWFRLPWGGRWHRTPTVAGNNAPNACGDVIPKREYGKAVYEQWYSNCAKERIISHNF